MQNDAIYLTRNHTVASFLKDCSACAACQTACPFLEIHGTPDAILQSSDDTVFLCTNCRACEPLCPAGLSPADAFFAAKTERIGNGMLSKRTHKALAGARGYAQRGHSFPFSAWRPAKTVFWPGCGLAGSLPDAVTAVRRELTSLLNEPVGLIVDCCFDPAYQLGDLATVESALREIEKRFVSGGVERIITGCVNCAKVLSEIRAGIRIEHVLQVLPATLFRQELMPESLHHPCPSSRISGLREQAAAICCTAYRADESPACCGCGGGLHVLDPDLARMFAVRANSGKRGSKVVTYCVGCRSAFRSAGIIAHHVLEYLPSLAPRTVHISSGRKWLNRLLVGVRAMIDLR